MRLQKQNDVTVQRKQINQRSRSVWSVFTWHFIDNQGPKASLYRQRRLIKVAAPQRDKIKTFCLRLKIKIDSRKIKHIWLNLSLLFFSDAFAFISVGCFFVRGISLCMHDYQVVLMFSSVISSWSLTPKQVKQTDDFQFYCEKSALENCLTL